MKATRICSVEGCARPHYGRGYCRPHYRRWRAHGDAGTTPIVIRDPDRPCAIEGCERPYYGRGFCNMHWQRWRDFGDPEYISPPAVRERHGFWIGDDAGYLAVHKRLHRWRGPADQFKCEQCGEQARDWSYDHTDPDQRYESGKPYSIDLTRYVPLCISCHRILDKQRARLRQGEAPGRGTGG